MAFDVVIGADATPSSFSVVIGTTPPVVTPGRGPEPVAVFVMDTAEGGSTTFSFATDILKSLDGSENRTSLRTCPREVYAFNATMTELQMAALASRLAKDGASGSVFGIGLPYEALTVTETSTTTTVTVRDTSMADWLEPGARVVIIRLDRTARHTGVVQSSTATTITIDTAVPSPVAVEGSLIMPVMPCYLESQQDFGAYPVNAGEVSLRARALLFGNASSAWDPVPVGSAPEVVTYVDPGTAETFPVWDRRIDADDPNARNVLLGTEIIDRGGDYDIFAPWTFADLTRQIHYTIRSDSDRQWFKKFIGTVRGRQKRFLLPTWRPDLGTYVSGASTGLLVMQSDASEVADYATAWSESSGHMWLQLLRSDGTVHYRKVMDYADNGDGTQDILIDSPVTGTIEMVSLMEQCRLDTDDIAVEWEGNFGFVEISARVVQR